MAWRREFKIGAVALGVLAVISVAGAAIGVPGTGGTSGTTQIVDQGGAGIGVTYQVSLAAQGGTIAYWTTRRMLAAASGPPPTTQRTSAPKGTPRAVAFSGSPTTGALFFTTGGKAHFCSASAVDSTQGDLLLTAAHCVYDKSFAANVEYVPEYHGGKQPYGAWPVRSITVPVNWRKSHNVNMDFAFLAVGTRNGKSVEAATNGLTLGFNLSDNEKIEVIGHNDGEADPVHCATRSFRFRAGQLEFYCHGFRDGTSGGPWIVRYNAQHGTGTVFGVIGGYEEGGNYDWASYSAYFGSSARSLFEQAEHQPAPAPSPSPSAPASASPSPTGPVTTSYSPTPFPPG